MQNCAVGNQNIDATDAIDDGFMRTLDYDDDALARSYLKLVKSCFCILFNGIIVRQKTNTTHS